MSEYYHNVLIYKSSIRLAVDWYKAGWISFAEFKAMDKVLAEKYGMDALQLRQQYIMIWFMF